MRQGFNQTFSTVTLSTVVAAGAFSACSLGASGDPGQLGPATGGATSTKPGGGGSGGGTMKSTGGRSGGTGVFTEQCEGDDWPDPEAARHHGSCTRTGGELWQCTCDGTQRSVEGEECSDAMFEACNIQLGTHLYCEAGSAACWPGAGEGSPWRCRCAESEGLEDVQASSCTDAVDSHCGASCTDSVGICVENLFQGGLDCACWAPAQGTELLSLKPIETPAGGQPASCSATLALKCRSLCGTQAGHCRYGSEVYECDCADGSSATQMLDPAASVDPGDPATFPETACYDALAQACGEVVQPTTPSCSSTYRNVSGECEPLPKVAKDGEVPEATSFECTCQGSCALAPDDLPAAAGAPAANDPTCNNWMIIDSAASCGEALKGYCPGSIAPG
jgi:hypothetical protein